MHGAQILDVSRESWAEGLVSWDWKTQNLQGVTPSMGHWGLCATPMPASLAFPFRPLTYVSSSVLPCAPGQQIQHSDQSPEQQIHLILDWNLQNMGQYKPFFFLLLSQTFHYVGEMVAYVYMCVYQNKTPHYVINIWWLLLFSLIYPGMAYLVLSFIFLFRIVTTLLTFCRAVLIVLLFGKVTV